MSVLYKDSPAVAQILLPAAVLFIAVHAVDCHSTRLHTAVAEVKTGEEKFLLVHFNGRVDVLNRAAAETAVQQMADKVRQNPQSAVKTQRKVAVNSQESQPAATASDSGDEERDDVSDSSSDSSDSDNSSFNAPRRKSSRTRANRTKARTAGASGSTSLPEKLSSTLRPSAEACMRWKAAVQASKTVAELAFALSASTTQAAAFGVMNPDQEAADRVAAARQQRQQQLQVLQGRKGLSSSNSSNSGGGAMDVDDEELGRRSSRRNVKAPTHYSDTNTVELCKYWT